ncbi:DNA polymerase I [candidate division TM6 bacterium RIFCSPHIGHO2_12_FULL_36_22]|nr:MAG: DNA polymerase I [candidate division TM6 bacterium RIFCSPHIGHO2_12_FULL_36_22]
MENKNFKKTLFLVDGSSFLYRAYYGLKPLHTLDGRPVQAVYGFVRMVKKIMDTFDPHKFVLVWDSKGKTERHEIFPAYKETRQAPPSDLFEQKELINEFADLIELHQIALPGIEADDIIYSLAKDASQASENVIVISSDKDLYQMIDDNVHIFDPFKNTIVNQEDFEADKGFPVNKLSFYYALLGDSSDNIPGVRGIGKKGAVELVQNFDNLQNLYDNIDKVEKPRLKSALEANKDNAFLSEQLFKLRYHKLDIPELGFMFDKNKWSNAQSLFKQLNFRSLIQDSGKKESKQLSLLPQSEHLSIKKKYNFKPVLTKQDLDKVVEQIKKAGAFATDTETTGINPFCDRWIGISIATHTGESFYIPTGHKDAQVQQLTQEQVVAALKPVLEDPSIKKYLHNAKFDMHVLQQGGVVMQGLDFDTMIAASLAVEDWQSVGLKQLSEVILKEPMLTYSMVINEVKAKDFADVPIDLATEYAAADAHQTLQLYNYFKSILTESKLLDLYEKIEHPVIQVLTDMEAEGIYLDTDILKVLGDQVTQEISNIEAAIRDLVGSEVINLNSPKQIEDLLFNQLGLPPQKRKKTGYSTDQEVLEALSKLHPVPNLLLKYRELTKIQGTYIAALPEYVNPKTGRIHTSFSQTRTATGRLASSDPNLQNIPVESNVKVRSAFKPKEGNIFLAADYSQIELRVLAFLSQDPVLKKAFLEDKDIHAQTAAGLFGIDVNAVTAEQRGVGKRINFSILYGLTPFGLSKDLKIPLGKAREYIEKYFEQYPGVAQWMESVVESTKEHGYTQTLWGRRRSVPGIYENNKTLYEAAKRIAINTVAQGTAAEIMKLGMIELHKQLKKKGLQSKILLQIHDELLISVPESELKQVEELTRESLEKVVDWDIPLKVGMKIGSDWQEVTK